MQGRHDNPYGEYRTPRTTSEGLIAGVQNGDREKLDRLVDLYGPWIFRMAVNRLGSPEAAEDVSQEVFERVLASLGRFGHDGRPASFRRWLSGVTGNALSEHYRQNGQCHSGGESIADVIDQLSAREQDDPEARQAFINLAHRVYDMLRPYCEERTLQASWMTAIEHCPAAVVAERLGMSLSAVYTARSRVFLKLRQLLTRGLSQTLRDEFL